jgi:sporulation protein YlmC with PRC-barrel domain
MILPYSRLRGLPVVSADGRPVGRVQDVVVGPEDGDMAVRAVLVSPNRLALLAERFVPRPGTTTILVGSIASIDADCVRLRDDDD